jgi:hypothetical protein
LDIVSSIVRTWNISVGFFNFLGKLKTTTEISHVKYVVGWT